MISTNLSHVNIIKQDAKVGTMTKKGFSLMQLLHNLIREHGAYKSNNFDLDVDQLPLSDKRLLISHFESAEWYEYACESSLKTYTLFSEHKNHIQKLIDEECYEVYRDVMEEMRAYK
jgi:hypothetical protein